MLMNLALFLGAILWGLVVLFAGSRALQMRPDAPLWARIVLWVAFAGLFVSAFFSTVL